MTAQSATAHFRGLSDEARVEHWQAWKLGESASLPIPFGENPSCAAAVVSLALAKACWRSGDNLAVSYFHAGRNSGALWIYTVKQSSRNGTWRDSTNGGRKVFVGNFEPRLTLQLALAAPFAPVEPFDAFRDDPRGIDLSLVNQ